jgi:hypothetical protein
LRDNPFPPEATPSFQRLAGKLQIGIGGDEF